MKLEFLALKWAVTEKFRHYLLGAEFEIFTDNNPLVHFRTAPLGVLEQRWSAHLAQFHFTVKYRPGKSNPEDALSQMPQRAKAGTLAVAVACGSPNSNPLYCPRLYFSAHCFHHIHCCAPIHVLYS